MELARCYSFRGGSFHLGLTDGLTCDKLGSMFDPQKLLSMFSCGCGGVMNASGRRTLRRYWSIAESKPLIIGTAVDCGERRGTLETELGVMPDEYW